VSIREAAEHEIAERLGFAIEGANVPAEAVMGKRMRLDPQRRLVRVVGIEPTLLAEHDFESCASTSSATPARHPL
jgi:hypothetical protein